MNKVSASFPAPDTHNLRIEFGKHSGERWTRLPIGYLVWLINEGTQVAHIAQAELDRRGYTPPTDLVVSDHAVDRASLYCRKAWREHSKKDEGMMTWLKREAQTAYELADPQDDDLVAEYIGIKWVFARGELFPTLKTVIRRKSPSRAIASRGTK